MDDHWTINKFITNKLWITENEMKQYLKRKEKIRYNFTLDDMVHYKYPTGSIDCSIRSISWFCTLTDESDQAGYTTSE